jgi:mannan endo-1,6-alpha-mannosidase
MKWWEGSALFAAALNYWHVTGDTTYNEEVSLGLQWQGGDQGDYMPSNYSSYLVRIIMGRQELPELTIY